MDNQSKLIVLIFAVIVALGLAIPAFVMSMNCKSNFEGFGQGDCPPWEWGCDLLCKTDSDCEDNGSYCRRCGSEGPHLPNKKCGA